MTETKQSPATTVRQLMRRLGRVALATVEGPQPPMASPETGGGPYASLAMVALDHDASPLLLLSDLADHTQNIRRDPRVSLLFDGTIDADVPLAAERATVQGSIAVTAEPRHRHRYLARHPDAESYIGFGDFRLYRVAVDRAHLVAGFGRIHWLPAAAFMPDPAAATTLAEAEAQIVAHMNEDHADAVGLYATGLIGCSGGGWRMTGIDPDGCDLRRGAGYARLVFGQPVHDAESARMELVRLAKLARR